jgi:parallel beta-helix repeat protein
MRPFRPVFPGWLMAGAAAFFTMAAPSAFAATLCVSHDPHSGCFPTIAAAVSAASPGDTITVAPGIYNTAVQINEPLSLIGAGAEQTTINATGLSNGIFIDGFVNNRTPGNNTLNEVTVSGFTIENANFEGVLVRNASFVTLLNNRVRNNDVALVPASASCPNLPAFETNEGLDCGEGIHLIGVDHATIAGNTVSGNSGGILLSDETGPTDANVLQGNTVHDNPFDCGITLASHNPATITGSSTSFGVFNNTIVGNDSSKNGLGLAGAGAGVGLFAPGPHNQTYGNVVVGNRLTGNGLPGVALHNHAPTQNINLDDNVIVGNLIAGDGPDTNVETASGTSVPTGISLLGVSLIQGTVITGNIIADEATDIAINNGGNSSAVVDVHLNDLGSGTGVANLGAGAVNASENWWGCGNGPGTSGCSSVAGANVVTTPFLTQPIRPITTAGEASATTND